MQDESDRPEDAQGDAEKVVPPSSAAERPPGAAEPRGRATPEPEEAPVEARLVEPPPTPGPLDSGGRVAANTDATYATPSATGPHDAADAAPRNRAGRPRHWPVRPRLWPIPLILIASLFLLFAASVVAHLVAATVMLGTLPASPAAQRDLMDLMQESPWVLMVTLVAAQGGLLLPSLLAALLSPVPFRQRLGLVRGVWPLWSWLAAAAATPLVGLLTALLLGLFIKESEALREMSDLFRQHGRAGFLIPLALLIGALPAVCEELTFRGYVQTRLAQRLPALAAIGVSAVLFSLFHWNPIHWSDLVHVTAVFPMGLWLGWLSYRSGTVLPAVLAHFANNVLSVMTMMEEEEGADIFALPPLAVTAAVLAVGLSGLTGVLIAAARSPQPARQRPAAPPAFPPLPSHSIAASSPAPGGLASSANPSADDSLPPAAEGSSEPPPPASPHRGD